MKIIFAMLAVITLTGCTTQSYAEWDQERRQKNIDALTAQSKATDSIPTCSSDKECQLKWEAAQVWVSNNSGYKIQTATSAIIETYNSTDSNTALSMRVVKEPLGEGKYRMVMSARCDNFLGCSTPPLIAIQNFNDYINRLK